MLIKEYYRYLLFLIKFNYLIEPILHLVPDFITYSVVVFYVL